MGIKQPKTSAGTKSGSFKVNAPVGKSSTANIKDVTNSLPGRSNNDVAGSSGLRGRESVAAYAKGRSYGK